ncbi:hypothetical protein LCGC14_2031060, partial [marine sediment metagenome]
VWRRALTWAALAAAIAYGGALSWRKITSVDIGYHLAYGDYFLDRGKLVDSNLFVYTRITPESAGEPGPSNWFDAEERYRFPNPSAASEVVFSLVHRAAGPTGLCVLQLAQVLVLLALAAATLIRLHVPRVLAAAGIVLIATTAHERFIHRPEMFGYLFIALQLLLLTSPRRGKLRAVALILTQWLFVQFHATWILGLSMTGAFFAVAVFRAVWARCVTQRPMDEELRGRLKWLGIILGAQIAVAFINPWTWRLAALPVQMLAYIRKHGIAGGATSGSTHPWAMLDELPRSLAKVFANRRATWAFKAVLVLTALGAAANVVMLILTALRVVAKTPQWRRWAHLLLLAGMTAVGLSIRRNIAPAALVLVPISLAALVALARALPQRLRPAGWVRAMAPVALAGAVVILSAWWGRAVVTNRFYREDPGIWRFGTGFSETNMPLAAAEICRELPPGVKVFTTYSTGSNLMYHARGPDGPLPVPILSNSWAFPPSVMGENQAICWGTRPLKRFAARYGVGAVVLESSQWTERLIRSLARDSDWSLAELHPRHVVFLYRIGPTAPLAVRHFLHPGHPRVAELIDRTQRGGPVEAPTANALAWTLERLGWHDQAIRAWRAAVGMDDEYHQAMNNLAMRLAIRGTWRLDEMRRLLEANREPEAVTARLEGLRDWQQAESWLKKALRDWPIRNRAACGCRPPGRSAPIVSSAGPDRRAVEATHRSIPGAS